MNTLRRYVGHYFVYLVVMVPLIAILTAQQPPKDVKVPTPPVATAATASTGDIPDKIVLNFWRAKSELSEAESNCRLSNPNYTAAKARWDAVVVEIRTFCKAEGIFRTDGNPGCPVASNPQTSATVPSATPTAKK